MRRLLALALLLTSCEPEGQETLASSNGRVPTGVLTRVDGCTIYYFETNRRHYFVRCGQETTTTLNSWTEGCGKNCRRTVDDEVVTKVEP